MNFLIQTIICTQFLQIKHDRFGPVFRHWFLLSHVLSLDMEQNHLHCQINLTPTFCFRFKVNREVWCSTVKLFSHLVHSISVKSLVKYLLKDDLSFSFSFLLNKEMEFCPFSFSQCCPCEIVLSMIPAQIKIGTIDGVFEFFSSIINEKVSSLSVG